VVVLVVVVVVVVVAVIVEVLIVAVVAELVSSGSYNNYNHFMYFQTAAAALKINFHEHSKKTKKRQRLIQKAESKNSKLRKEQENAISGEGSDKSKGFSAHTYIHT
jgi:hypothetical protein